MVYTSDYPVFWVTVDIAVFTIVGDDLSVLLIRRRGEPDAGRLALPGGFVDPEEDLAEAARRELAEETGVSDVVLEQLASYGAPHRDPRGRVVSVAHLAVLPAAVSARAGDDAAEAGWVPVADVLGPGATEVLAFDHAQVLADALERVRAKLEYTTLATAFVAEEFTLSELRRVYEITWGVSLDPANFWRKIRQTEDFVEPTGATRSVPGRGRPAALFRIKHSPDGVDTGGSGSTGGGGSSGSSGGSGSAVRLLARPLIRTHS